jgi:hypothetical protein
MNKRNRDMAYWLAENNVFPFTGLFKWFSNGERGHLHVTRRCEKVTRSKTATVERNLTLFQAQDSYVVCDDCIWEISGVSLDHSKVLNAATDLYTYRAQAERIDTQTLQDAGNSISGYPALNAALRRRVLTDLLARTREMVLPEDLDQVQQRVAAEISALLTEHRVDQAAVIDEALHLAASSSARSAIMEEFRRGGVWVSKELQQTFNMGSYSNRNPVEVLVKQWSGQAPTADPDSTMKECVAIAAAEAVSNLASTAQLNHVPALCALPGESALEAAQRSFTAYAHAALGDLADRILVRHHEMLGRRQLVAFAFEDRWEEWFACPPRNAAAVLLQDGALSRGKGRYLVVLPEALAKWIASTCLNHQVISELIAVDHTPDPAVADTALALWDPRSQGPYRGLAAALDAAQLL